MTRPVIRILAGFGLAAASPVLALAGAAIKASSSGPVLFRACRVGLYGRRFTMFKLRTMHRRPVSVARITGGRDPRVFPAGRWLRRFKVDELPQLVNVVRGDMALVGPRPEDPAIVAEHYSPLMLETLSVLPGLTSPGSLSYFADERSLPDDAEKAERLYVSVLLPHKIALDLVYVRHRSWRYDVELVVRTVASMAGLSTLFRRRQEWERAEAGRLLETAGEAGRSRVDVLP